MILSKRTINILKNFSTINQSVLFTTGNTVRTINNSKTKKINKSYTKVLVVLTAHCSLTAPSLLYSKQYSEWSAGTAEAPTRRRPLLGRLTDC